MNCSFTEEKIIVGNSPVKNLTLYFIAANGQGGGTLSDTGGDN